MKPYTAYLPDLDDLKGRPYSRRLDRMLTTYTPWPKAPTHDDLDPLLRAAKRAEAERKAAAAEYGKKFNRILRRRG